MTFRGRLKITGLKSVSVLIGLPAYNESLSIPPLLAKIKLLSVVPGLDVHIALFDDGSIDDTSLKFSEICNKESLQGNILGDGKNHGLGYGIRSIFDYYVHKTKFDYLVIMDCDDTHDPAQIVQLIERAENQQLDVVIASRYRKGSEIFGVSKLRQLISGVAGIYLRLLFPLSGIRDFTCGFRLYNRLSLENLAKQTKNLYFKRDGFSCMPEIILRTHKAAFNIGEIPMILGYDRKLSASKMKFLKNIREILILGIQMRLNFEN